MDNPIIEYHPGRGYKVSQIVGLADGNRLPIYTTKNAAGDVARMGGWKRSDVVKVWTPLFGGYMPAYSSVNGEGKPSLVFLTTDFLSVEFEFIELPWKRERPQDAILSESAPAGGWRHGDVAEL